MPAQPQHPTEFARELCRVTPRDVAKCGELVEIKAAGGAGDGDATWHLAAFLEDGQRYTAHVGREFEIVEGVTVGADAGERTAQLVRISDGVGRDLGQPDGDDSLGGAHVPKREQHLADRAAMKRQAVADLEVDGDALRTGAAV